MMLRAPVPQLQARICLSAKISWTARASVRKNLRGGVQRILGKHTHLPDQQEESAQTILEPVVHLRQT